MNIMIYGHSSADSHDLTTHTHPLLGLADLDLEIYIQEKGLLRWGPTAPRRVARAPTMQTSPDQRSWGSQKVKKISFLSSRYHNSVSDSFTVKYRQANIKYQEENLSSFIFTQYI